MVTSELVESTQVHCQSAFVRTFPGDNEKPRGEHDPQWMHLSQMWQDRGLDHGKRVGPKEGRRTDLGSPRTTLESPVGGMPGGDPSRQEARGWRVTYSEGVERLGYVYPVGTGVLLT